MFLETISWILYSTSRWACLRIGVPSTEIPVVLKGSLIQKTSPLYQVKIFHHKWLNLTHSIPVRSLLEVTLKCNVNTLNGEGNGTPLQYSCLENPMEGGAWWAAVHGVARSRTRLSDFPFTIHFQALEKEMATHSSVRAWRIPGTGEPGGCSLWGHTESDTTEVT